MTTHSTWGVNPAYVRVSHDDIRAAVALMRELGVKRMAFSGLELDLEPLSRAAVDVGPPMEPQGVLAETTGSVCACGHSWATEHTDAGCLMGCSHDLCSSDNGASNV